MSKKISKQQLKLKQAQEDKKFYRILKISFFFLVVSVVTVLIFYTYHCETSFLYRKWAWYGKPIPREWICMNGNNLQLHKSTKVEYKNNEYNFCSQHCFDHLVKHFSEVSMTIDAFSKDTILKAEAIMGVKEKGSNLIVYFKNEDTFEKYYRK